MRRRGLYCILLLLALLPYYSALCQKILHPELNPPDKRFDNFIVGNGRYGPVSTCIFQDRKGFIWCGLEYGLSRFDGINYTTFGAGDSDTTILGYSVTSITEDTGGDIWAGTYGALNRINMQTGRIRHFLPDSADANSPDNAIRLIREDSRGVLWLITNRHIFTFDPDAETFTLLPVDSLAWHNGYTATAYESPRFLEDTEGRVWIATDNGLYLYRFENRSWKKVYPVPGDTDAGQKYRITCVEQDHAGNIWAGTETGELIHLADEAEMILREEPLLCTNDVAGDIKTVTALHADSAGKLWIYGEKRLLCRESETGMCAGYLFAEDSSVYRYWRNTKYTIDEIFPGRNGSLWLINLFNGLAFQFYPQFEKLSLYNVPRYIVLNTLMDNTGSLWFGTVANNMYRLVTDSLPVMSARINSNFYPTTNRKTLLASFGDRGVIICMSDGFYRIDAVDESSQIKPERIETPGDIIKPSCVFRDSKNNYWLGCEEGVILRYNPVENRFVKYMLQTNQTSEQYGNTTIITEDSTGAIWFATRNEGIFLLTPRSGQIKPFLMYNELQAENTTDILSDFIIDSHNCLWISTGTELFMVDIATREVRDLTGFDNTGRNMGSVYGRIIEDSNSGIWVLNITSGVYRFNRNDNTFSRLNTPILSQSIAYTDMLFDHYGKLWLARFDRITVIDTAVKDARDIYLPVKGFDAQSIRLSTGTILYIIVDRLLIMPEIVPINRYIPPLYITSLQVNGTEFSRLFPGSEPVTDLDEVVLKHDQNYLSIGYAALNYTQPDLNRYRYYMDGIDMDIIESGPGVLAEYRDMPPGRYTFRVTGSNNDGIWNRNGISLNIRIHPPWYRTALAWCIYGIVFLSLLAFYVRLRTYRLSRDKMRLQAEIEVHTAELARKNLQLAENDRIKTSFFTAISHEIRTPLTLITGPLDTLAKDEYLTGKMARMVDIMRRNASRLINLVNQILDISRLDAGKMKISLEQEDIIKFLRILAYEFLSLAESKHIKYIADLPDKEFITWFDKDKVEKMVSNLLTNAFKFTPQNGTVVLSGRIEIREDISVRQVLIISVKDTGPGIEKEHQDRIFDRFYRVEDQRGSDDQGTGVGLSLVKEFARVLHGDITVSSKPGEGSVFILSLPVGKDHLSPDEYVIHTAPAAHSGQAERENLKMKLTGDDLNKASAGRMKILIIEDNDDLRNYITESLAGEYFALGAENGRTGLNTAMTMIPDLIITDIMMPDLDGITLCSRLKNDEHTSHIPIIMLTARAASEDKIAGLKSGADDYIIKPFRMDELKVRITNLLETRIKLRKKYSSYLKSQLTEIKTGSVDDRFMVRVIRVINENLTNYDFDVDLLKKQLGISRMHLSRKIKVLTGFTPAVLIRNIRLERASALLRQNSGNITEIANSVGISNPSGFTRAFRNYFGISPRDYARQKASKEL